MSAILDPSTEEYRLPQEHPRRRLQRRVESVGLAQLEGRRSMPRMGYAVSTLNLAWPDGGYALQQMVDRDRTQEDVAKEIGVRDRRLRTIVNGGLANKRYELGAIDWLVILFELYREADELVPDGAEAVWACFDHATLW